MPALQKSDIKKITQVQFPETQYYKEERPKKQLVTHHTVSGPNAARVFEGWASNPGRVATAFVIEADGIITQGFNSKFLAHRLGLKKINNTALNKASVATEVYNWGGLTVKDGKYYSAYNREVPSSEVIDYKKIGAATVFFISIPRFRHAPQAVLAECFSRFQHNRWILPPV